MNEVTIRVYVPGDAPVFSALNMEWLTTFFQAEAKDAATLSDPEGQILAPGGQIFLADLSEKAVGCVALLAMGDGSYEVAKMAVTPKAQGRGVGRRLLQAAIGWARAQGAKRLYLESNHVLAPALHLYESVGFRHLPPEEVAASPYARADVFMELWLTEEAARTRPGA